MPIGKLRRAMRTVCLDHVVRAHSPQGGNARLAHRAPGNELYSYCFPNHRRIGSLLCSCSSSCSNNLHSPRTLPCEFYRLAMHVLACCALERFNVRIFGGNARHTTFGITCRNPNVGNPPSLGRGGFINPTLHGGGTVVYGYHALKVLIWKTLLKGYVYRGQVQRKRDVVSIEILSVIRGQTPPPAWGGAHRKQMGLFPGAPSLHGE